LVAEDHNLVNSSWPERVKSALDRCDPGVTVVIGVATNTRSTTYSSAVSPKLPTITGVMGELPRGTTMRMQLLALAHSLGALFGGWFGVGRAPWVLE